MYNYLLNKIVLIVPIVSQQKKFLFLNQNHFDKIYTLSSNTIAGDKKENLMNEAITFQKKASFVLDTFIPDT